LKDKFLSRRAKNAISAQNINTFEELEQAVSGMLSGIGISGIGFKTTHELKSYVEHVNKNPEDNYFLTIESTKLSKRAKNGLKKAGIYNINQLRNVSEAEILKIKNLGAGTLKSIIEYLNNEKNENKKSFKTENAFLNTSTNFDDKEIRQILTLNEREEAILAILGAKKIKDFLCFSASRIQKLKSVNKILRDIILHSNYELNPKGFDQKQPDFKQLIDICLIDCVKKIEQREVMKERIIGDKTLEECGKMLGVTRERIRQYETKFIQSFKSLNDSKHIESLHKYLVNNREIRSVIDLELKVNEFKGIVKMHNLPEFPQSVHKLFFGNQDKFKYEFYNKKFYAYSKDSARNKELIDKFPEYIFSSNTKDQSIKDMFRIFCIINKRRESSDVLWEHALKKLETRVTYIVKTALQFLRKPGQILLLQDIMDFIKLNFHKKVDIRRVDGICSDEIDNLFLYKKRSYIFFDDVNLTNKEIKLFEDSAIKIIKSDTSKSHSLESVTDDIKQEFENNAYISKSSLAYLNHHILNIILEQRAKEFSDLRDLGRFQWSSGGQISKRVEMYPLIVEILKQNKGPMRASEIRRELNEKRGVPKLFQIHITKSAPDVIYIKPGLYGLRERDTDFPLSLEFKMVDQIIEGISKDDGTIKPKEFDELKKNIEIPTKYTNIFILRLLDRHIPSGGKRSNAKFLIKKQIHSDKNFIIYNPKISDEIVKKYLDDNKDKDITNPVVRDHYWDMEKVISFLLSNNILSEKDYRVFRRSEDKNLQFLPGITKLSKSHDFPGWRKIQEMKKNEGI